LSWKTAANVTVLQRGDKGELVFLLQRLIGAKVDGYFGPGTEQKVMESQKVLGLVKDKGRVTSEMLLRLALNDEPSKDVPADEMRLPELFPRPRGYANIVKVFGEPGQVKLGKAKVPDEFKRLVYLKSGFLTCHHLLVPRVEWVFAQIAGKGLGSKIKSYDGCYNPRKKRGGSDWSTHAWAIALDINAADNMPGMKNSIDRGIIDIFTAAGFLQLAGDPMHFQYCEGY